MYIEQGKRGNLGLWKYLPIPLAFFGLMGLNYLASQYLNVNDLIQDQIAEKGKNRFFAENLIFFVFLLGGLFFWVRYVHVQSITSLTTARLKIDWKRVFFMFTVTALYIIISTLLAYYSAPQDYIVSFNMEAFAILAVLAILLVPIQTSFEEYLFRGYLMQGLGIATGKRWIPLFLTSIFFGVMHAANPEVDTLGPIIMVYYIGTGLFLAILTLMDDGMELALGFHAANNLITALLVTSNWTAFQTDSILIYTAEPESTYEVLIPVFIIFPIFIFGLSRKYKWKNWREKLFGDVKDLPGEPEQNEIEVG